MAKLSYLEDSRDISKLPISEFINILQAPDQRIAMRITDSETVVEEALLPKSSNRKKKCNHYKTSGHEEKDC